MPEFLASTVTRRTRLDDRFLAAAAPEAMTAYLDDWEKAARRLNAYIAVLRAARDQRQTAKDRGEWPDSYTRPPEGTTRANALRTELGL